MNVPQHDFVKLDRRRKSGFTFTEVIIAVTILVLGVVSIIYLGNTILRMNALSGEVTGGTSLALSTVETLVRSDYDSVASGSSTSASYHVAWSASEDMALDLKTVDIIVTWNDLHNNPHQVAMKSMLNRP